MRYWMETYTHQRIDLERPQSALLDIEDIAHSLSMQCRYAGHVREFYSVAEHSILVASIVDPRYALQGLMHDAHEAYVQDVIAPAKQIDLNIGYRVHEHRFELEVDRQYGLYGKDAAFDMEAGAAVRRADMQMLALERRDVVQAAHPWPSCEGVELPDVEIRFLNPREAKREFKRVYRDLTAAKE